MLQYGGGIMVDKGAVVTDVVDAVPVLAFYGLEAK